VNGSDTSVRQLGSGGREGFGIDFWRRVGKGTSVSGQGHVIQLVKAGRGASTV
jgi:hypothetical protein